MKWVLLIILINNQAVVGGVYDHKEQCSINAKYVRAKFAKAACIRENGRAVDFFKNPEKKKFMDRGNSEDL